MLGKAANNLGLFSDEKKEPISGKVDAIQGSAGFDDIAEATRSAPVTTSATPGAAPRTRRGRPGAQPTPVTPPTPVKTAAQAEAEQRKLDALKTIGEAMMRDMADTPYEIWAYLAQDESLKLTKEESKELAQAYVLVAQTMDFTNLSPFWSGMIFIAAKNAKLAGQRIKLIADKKAKTTDGETTPGDMHGMGIN
jgi:hypothetical protein